MEDRVDSWTAGEQALLRRYGAERGTELILRLRVKRAHFEQLRTEANAAAKAMREIIHDEETGSSSSSSGERFSLGAFMLALVGIPPRSSSSSSSPSALAPSSTSSSAEAPSAPSAPPATGEASALVEAVEAGQPTATTVRAEISEVVNPSSSSSLVAELAAKNRARARTREDGSSTSSSSSAPVSPQHETALGSEALDWTKPAGPPASAQPWAGEDSPDETEVHGTPLEPASTSSSEPPKVGE